MAMHLEDLYRLAIEAGMEADPRKGAELDMHFKRVREAYERMGEREKEVFDLDAMWNPYADSRIVHGDPRTEVDAVLWGIDINTPELLLADRLREKGRGIDAVIGHHPRGRAAASLHQMVTIQENMMEEWGVPITTAECLERPRAHEVMCSYHSVNHAQVGDAARLLDIPLMCLHQPADLLAQRFMREYLEAEAPDRLRDLVDALLALPEYRAAARECNPPEIFAGDRDKRVGAVAVKFAGGDHRAQGHVRAPVPGGHRHGGVHARAREPRGGGAEAPCQHRGSEPRGLRLAGDQPAGGQV